MRIARSLLLPICVLLAIAASAAENLVVFDREITVTGGTHHWPCAEGLPADWTEPVDYSRGRLHIQWEILEAPADAAGHLLQIGWTFPWEGSKENKAYQLTRFKYQRLLFGERFRARVPADELPLSGEPESPNWVAGERYHTVHVMGSGRFFWPLPEKEPKDFSQGIDGIMAFSRAEDWGVRGPSAPVRMRVTMTLVPPGGSYVPPYCYGGVRPRDLPALPAVVEAMNARRPGRALRLAEAVLADAESGADARVQAERAVAAFNAHLDGALVACREEFASDPLSALETLADLTAAFDGTARDAELQALGAEWSASEAVARERKADPARRAAIELLAEVEKQADGPLGDPAVQRRHAGKLRRVAATWQALRKRYPESAACRKLTALLQDKGLLPAERTGGD